MNPRFFAIYLVYSILLVVGLATRSEALPLPLNVAPAAPFPLVLSLAVTTEFVAPGVTYGEYRFWTSSGPLQVHVIAVDPRTESIRLNPVVASDRLVSNGETLSSMAVRTGAVAGINADYFDINNTYQPLGIVMRDGILLRTPSKRAAFAFTRRRLVHLSAVHFAGTAEIGDIPVKLSAINEFPPEGGAALLTPAFGKVPSANGVLLARLTPESAVTPFGRYQIMSVEQAPSINAAGYALALGPAAQEIVGTPNPGDRVTISSSADSRLEDIVAAVGGGPLLVHNGMWFDDPDAPAMDERTVRIPASGAATQPDGSVLLFEIDGRQPSDSVGVTRAEFSSLMRAFDATEGMAFDGGGSSTLVTRRLGDPAPTLRNVPSDGVERRVGDGLFVYSDAPQGAASRLVVRPSILRMLPGASATLQTALTDAAGHTRSSLGAPRSVRAIPRSLGDLSGNIFMAGKPQEGTLHVERGAIATNVPVHIVQRVARLMITPARMNPQPHVRVQLSARAFDRSGFPILLPARLPWHVTSGTIEGGGLFTPSDANAVVSVMAGAAEARLSVLVGRHEEPLAIGTLWAFASVPAGNPGMLEYGTRCGSCIELSYDFRGSERGAYMNGALPLPDNAVGLSMDVFGNNSGAALRAALVNGINERLPVTIAQSINWQGWRRREISFPLGATSPLHLRSLYVLRALEGTAIRTAGSVGFRDFRVVVAGK